MAKSGKHHMLTEPPATHSCASLATSYIVCPADAIGQTPLQQACYGGHTDAALFLLLAGAQPDARNFRRGTALMAAVQAGFPHTFAQLHACFPTSWQGGHACITHHMINQL